MPRDTARQALSNEWFERLVRIGHAAKGAVFGALGVIAARLALGDSRDTPDFPGALEALAEQPVDVLFLSVLALGLLAYAAWRFAYGIADPDDLNGSLRGWLQRGIMFGVGATYAGFGVYAVALLLGLRRRDDPGLDDEAATIFTLPAGEWIVAAIGLGVVIAGLHEIYVAFSGRFRDEFTNADLRSWEKGLVLGAGWWGHAARGAIYCVAGFFGVKAGVTYDANEARGFSETLWEIGSGPYGDWLLFGAAAGLVCFGLYSILLAIHRHVPDPDGGGVRTGGRGRREWADADADTGTGRGPRVGGDGGVGGAGERVSG